MKKHHSAGRGGWTLPVVAAALSSLLLAPLSAREPASRRALSVIPKPGSIELLPGEFGLAPGLRIEVEPAEPAAVSVGEQLAQRLRLVTGLPVLSQGEGQGSGEKLVRLALRKDLGRLGPEGYRLSVSAKAVVVEALKPAGLFYGVQTLLQLLPFAPASASAPGVPDLTLPCLKIEDRPRFGWRGAHLDVCLHFYPVAFVKKYIDVLAMYKMNVFHWHLTEDQGWRIEIKKYPALTQVGAWRRETTYDGKPYGGFYTQDEIRDVVDYAAKRFITVVPEIEMPGHCLSALAAYPELSCSGGPFDVETNWGIYPDVFCVGSEKTFTFLEDVLTEVFALFPSEFIHVGGDEVPKTRWRNCVRCQARMKAEGLTDEKELQSYFIKRIEKFVNSRGRRLVGWDEILEGGLAPNATVMSWRGIAGGIQAAREGHDVVMAPTSHCYFDYYQAKQGEPEAFPAYLPIETVYGYEPIPADLTPAEARHILGAQACVWTEYMPDEAQVEYMLLPRLLALSEVVWTEKDLRDYRDFSGRLIPHFDRLAALGLNFRLPPPGGLGGRRVGTAPVTLDVTPPYAGAVVRYTTDGAEPAPASPVLDRPELHVETSALVQARTFLASGRGSRTASTSVSLIDPERNGISYSYYEGTWFSLPDLARLTPARSGRAPAVTLETAGTRPENFGVRFEGFIAIPESGDYTFWIQADDGASLSIAEREIARNDGVFTILEVSGRATLEAGRWPISLSYFQKTGGEALEVFVQGPGIVRQILPAHWLFLKK